MKTVYLMVISAFLTTCMASQGIETETITELVPYNDKSVKVPGIPDEHQGLLLSIVKPKVIEQGKKLPTVFFVHGSMESHVLKDGVKLANLASLNRQNFADQYRVKKDFLLYAEDLAKQGFVVAIANYWGGGEPCPETTIKKYYSVHNPYFGHDFLSMSDYVKNITYVNKDNITAVLHSQGFTRGILAIKKYPTLFNHVIDLAGVPDWFVHHNELTSHPFTGDLSELNILSVMSLKSTISCAYFDVYNHPESGLKVEKWNLAHSPVFNQGLYKLISPFGWEKGEFPKINFTIVHAENDSMVGPQQSLELSRHLVEIGVPHHFYMLSKGDHGFFKIKTEGGRDQEGEPNEDVKYNEKSSQFLTKLLIKISKELPTISDFKFITVDVDSGKEESLSKEGQKSYEETNFKERLLGIKPHLDLLRNYRTNPKPYLLKMIEIEREYAEEEGNEMISDIDEIKKEVNSIIEEIKDEKEKVEKLTNFFEGYWQGKSYINASMEILTSNKEDTVKVKEIQESVNALKSSDLYEHIYVRVKDLEDELKLLG